MGSRAVLVALALLAASVPAFGQGRLEVTLLNAANNQPIAGAEVRLENPAIGSTATERTSAQGKARFSALSTAGEYTVSAPESAGFEAVRTSRIVLRTSADRSVTLLAAPRQSFAATIEAKG